MQEGDPNDSKLNMKASSSSTSSRPWGGLRNPRIVRVSRSFGGKDRHSKVYTIRGLRDRRIRLSVPTAIQLYGLQDKLGLSQPSKVVDWLLDVAKNDIDKLPPLQMPQGNLGQFFQQSIPPQSSMPHFFNPNSYGKLQSEKDKWNINATNDQENHEGSSFEGYASQITAQNFFPIVNQSSSFPNIVASNYLPYNYNSYYQLEANPNLSLSQFGSNNHNLFSSQAEEHQPLYFCPSTSNFPTIFNPPLPSYTTMENSNEHSNRQINHFQILNSSTQQLPLIPTLHFISSPMKSLSFNVNPKILHPQETDDNEGGNGS